MTFGSKFKLSQRQSRVFCYNNWNLSDFCDSVLPIICALCPSLPSTHAWLETHVQRITEPQETIPHRPSSPKTNNFHLKEVGGKKEHWLALCLQNSSGNTRILGICLFALWWPIRQENPQMKTVLWCYVLWWNVVLLWWQCCPRCPWVALRELRNSQFMKYMDCCVTFSSFGTEDFLQRVKPIPCIANRAGHSMTHRSKNSIFKFTLLLLPHGFISWPVRKDLL